MATNLNTINYGGSYTYDAPLSLTNMFSPMALYQEPSFSNVGAIVDPTLLAAQEILARPVSRRGFDLSSLNLRGSGVGGVTSPYDYGLLPQTPQFDAEEYRRRMAEEAAAAAASGAEGGPADMPVSSSDVGGYGTSGLVDASGNFPSGSGLGQGISSTQQNIGLGLMNYGQTAGGLLPGGTIANAVGQAMVDSQINAINESLGLLGTIGQQPGMVSVSDAQGNVASMVTPQSIAKADFDEFGVVSIGGNLADATGIDVGQASMGDPEGAQAVADAAANAAANAAAVANAVQSVEGAGIAAASGAADSSVDTSGIDASQASMGDPEGAQAAADGGGGGGGGGKIICTAMNHAYGFGSFRNAIWIAYADKHLTKAHEVGYHALFLPLVDFGFKRGDGKLNLLVRKVLEWGTRHRSTDLRAEMRGTKRDNTGRIIRWIFEPLCYAVGKLKGY
ncbi:MAG: hypothetical protein ACO3IP_07700 [Burkholderiaceae bacterium]